MKKLKILLIVLATVLFSSCMVTMPVTAQDYDINQLEYNYDQIDYYYNTNIAWFYNNYYYNSSGIRFYWYQHPYFIRYCETYYTRYQRHIPRYTHQTYRNHVRLNNGRNVRKPRRAQSTRNYNEFNRRNVVRRAQARSTQRTNVGNRARNLRLKPNVKPRKDIRRNIYPINRVRTKPSVRRTPTRSNVRRNTSVQRTRSTVQRRTPTRTRKQKN